MSHHPNPMRDLTIIELAIALVVIGGIGLIAWRVLAPQATTPPTSQNKTEPDVALVHTNQSATLARARTLADTESSAIKLPTKPAKDITVDQKCTHYPPTEFGQKGAINCRLRRYAYIVGSGDPQADIKTTYEAAAAAGWNTSEGAGQSRYDQYLRDATYLGAFPIGLTKSPDTSNYLNHTININLLTSENASSGYYEDQPNDTTYRDMTQQLLKSPRDYIYGYTLEYLYYFARDN